MLVEEQRSNPGEDTAATDRSQVPEPGGLGAVWAWAAMGLLGSVVTAFEGTHLLGTGAPRWWYVAALPAGHTPTKIVFWSGVTLLCGAWLGLGWTLKRSRREVPLRALWVVGICWCVPFLLGPPLFSRDVYSYLAQGMLVHLGHSPYRDAPVVLARLGQQRVLNGVDSFWRNTTAPYGPLFLAVISLIVGATGSNLVVGAVLIRLLNLIGIVVLAIFAPRLARTLGADPRRAFWLAVLSPLVFLQLISPAHNDALMVGLMVAGVALAMERRPLLGIGICAVAVTIKVPAAVAIVFIAIAWARTLPDRSEQLRALAKAAAVTVVIAAIVTLATGLGLAWISTGLFSTPGKVRLSITPATAVGYTLVRLFHTLLGLRVEGKNFEETLTHVAFAFAAVFALVLLYRTRFENLVRYLGLVLVAVAIGGPAAWPWYFSWGLALLAACPSIQFSRAIALAVAASAFVVIPNGQLALTIFASPYMIGFYVLVVAATWLYWRRRREAGAQELPGGAASMLAKP
jgi:hypothetical protein